ncbi:hypothetical protein [Shigella dysenteriae]|uniref:hypothetical protein n=1 Tax=Shigella dysenteriae TaxID=622 RepID=UPI001F199B24|nr:hypothetical protein [Shigella dysenteriae]
MNVNAGHERTSKARIIHQIQLIRGITKKMYSHAFARCHRRAFFTINILRHSRRFFKCAYKALLPAAS